MFKSLLIVIARVSFSLIFIIAGFDKIVNYDQTLQTMVAAGIPYAQIALLGSIIFEFGGGLLVLLGLFTRFGALLIFLFTIPVTFYFHSFWTFEQVQDVINNMHHFFKNLAIMGAALYIMVYGPGKLSIDGLRSRQ